MKLETIWIVTKPYDKESTLGDICFSCNTYHLMLQFRGGLLSDEIEGMFSTETEAVECATKLLEAIK